MQAEENWECGSQHTKEVQYKDRDFYYKLCKLTHFATFDASDPQKIGIMWIAEQARRVKNRVGIVKGNIQRRPCRVNNAR